MSSSIDTHMMLILPVDYKRVYKEKHENSIDPKRNIKPIRLLGKWLLSDMPALKFAEIRKSSGRVGECRFRYIEEIGSITLTESFTAQKRWYKAMIAYSPEGIKKGRPQVEFLYFNIDPWMLQRLALTADKKQNH